MRIRVELSSARAVGASLALAQIVQEGAGRLIEIAEDPGKGPPFDGATCGGSLGFFREDWFCPWAEASCFRLNSPRGFGVPRLLQRGTGMNRQ